MFIFLTQLHGDLMFQQTEIIMWNFFAALAAISADPQWGSGAASWRIYGTPLTSSSTFLFGRLPDIQLLYLGVSVVSPAHPTISTVTTTTTTTVYPYMVCAGQYSVNGNIETYKRPIKYVKSLLFSNLKALSRLHVNKGLPVLVN